MLKMIRSPERWTTTGGQIGALGDAGAARIAAGDGGLRGEASILGTAAIGGKPHAAIY